MGLAASQARLLLLTARKDDVEGQLMTFANQKLSLGRKAADISTAYSNALNAQKLVWQADNGDDVDLTYNLLMKPNNTAEAGQYIVTNTSNGKIMLDNSYINTLGIGASGSVGDISKSMSQTQFIEKMMGIKTSAPKPVQPPKTHMVTITNPITYNDSDVYNYLDSMNNSAAVNNSSFKSGGTGGGPLDSDFSYNLSQFTFLNLNGENVGTAQSTFSTLASCIGSDVCKALQKLTGMGSSSAQTAMQYAISQTESQFNGYFLSKTSNRASARSQVAGTNGIATGKDDDSYSVDVNQVIGTLLTYFDQYCEQNYGGQNTSTVGYGSTSRSGGGCVGVTTSTKEVVDTPTDTTPTSDASVDENHNDVSDSYEHTFYANLYDSINYYGWQTSDNVGTEKYLQNMVLNGGITLKKLQHDGSWQALSSGDSDTPLSATTDTAGIAKAEAEYDSEKAKIDAKEQQIDLQMKNLDSERAACDTEIDSVQKIIDKNIERSFKMFQA